MGQKYNVFILFCCWPASLVHSGSFHLHWLPLLQCPCLLSPWGMQCSADFSVALFSFLSVSSVHCHFISLICCLIGCWLVICHRTSFDITSGHLIFKIHHRPLLVKTCSCLIIGSVLPCFTAIQEDLFHTAVEESNISI